MLLSNIYILKKQDDKHTIRPRNGARGSTIS